MSRKGLIAAQGGEVTITCLVAQALSEGRGLAQDSFEVAG